MVTSATRDPLRAITSRLSGTSVKQLPSTIPDIVNSLLHYDDALQSALQSGKGSSDSVSLHKLRTKITTLLGSKEPEERWAAAILIKTFVGITGHDSLQACGHWVRGLISNLSKKDPPLTKGLAVIAVSQIFLLTDGHQTLTREMTTPTLPAYISACLNILSPKTSTISNAQLITVERILPLILESFCKLVPKHPTVFRTYVNQIQPILSQIVVPTLPSAHVSQVSFLQLLSGKPEVQQLSQKLQVLLSYCAPKGTASNEWAKSLDSLIKEAHLTATQIFRGILEDWRPIDGGDTFSVIQSKSFSKDPAMDWPTHHVALPHWIGLHAGCERLAALLKFIAQFSSCCTATAIHAPIARLLDLFIRLSSILPPLPNANAKDPRNMRVNDHIMEEEREAMWSELPRIHREALGMIRVVLIRFDKSLLSYGPTILRYVITVFNREINDEQSRASSYFTAAQLLNTVGATMTKHRFKQMIPLVQASCRDILPFQNEQNDLKRNGAIQLNGAEETSSPPITDLTLSRSHGLAKSAEIFLRAVFLKIPANLISDNLRSLMDQTATLSGLRDVMLASVLNPMPHAPTAKPHSSLLPLLARADCSSIVTETLLRPRRPLLLARSELNTASFGGNVSPQGDDPHQNTFEYSVSDLLRDRTTFKDAEPPLETAENDTGIQGPLAIASVIDEQRPQASSGMGVIHDTEIDVKLAPFSEEPDTEFKRKRSSIDELINDSAKRVRTVIQEASEGPEDEEDTSRLSDRIDSVTIVSEQPGSSTSDVQQEVSLLIQESAVLEPLIIPQSIEDNADDSDDENFVMPPLTIGPDSDDEDESS